MVEREASRAGAEIESVAVGVGGLHVATGDVRLCTFSLGSCLAISAWDPTLRIGGLLHVMLAQPAGDASVPATRVCNYATTGIPHLVETLESLGCRPSNLIVCAAGAAEVLNDPSVFAVGKRNRTMMRKILSRLDIVLAAEATGGSGARSMNLDIGSGRVSLSSDNIETTLWSE